MTKSNNVSDRRKEQLLNIAVMAAGGWLIWYLSGPYAAEIGRNAYEFAYDKIWGTPEWLSWRFLERAFYYTPNRGHFENWLFNYAEYASPVLAAPFLYKVPDVIRACVGKVIPKKSPEEVMVLSDSPRPNQEEEFMHLEKAKTFTPARHKSMQIQSEEPSTNTRTRSTFRASI